MLGPPWSHGTGWHIHWSVSCPVSSPARAGCDLHTLSAERVPDPHWMRERERETETVVILHLVNNKNTSCHGPHSHKDHIQPRHFITPDECMLSGQTRSAIWNHNRFTWTIFNRLTFKQVQHTEAAFTTVRRECARCLLAPITSIRQAWQLVILFITLHSFDKEWVEGIVEGNERVTQWHTNRKCLLDSWLTASARSGLNSFTIKSLPQLNWMN